MFSLIRKNIWASVMLSGLTVAALLLLVNSLIKGIFVLSNESAVQKATPVDIVLGTLSLGLVLLAVLGIIGAVFLTFKKQAFNKYVVFILFDTAVLLIIAGLLVVVKDHVSYTTDWKKINDIDQARFDIGSNLSLIHTLANDKFGNQGFASGGVQLNTLDISQYDAFLKQMIASKKDLAALYPLDEMLNKANQPLIAGILVDAMAKAYQMDSTHTLSVASWFASKSNANAWDFLNVITKIKVDLTNDNDLHKIINGLMSQPIVYTSLSSSYLQGFPITITGIVLVAVSVVAFTPKFLVKKEIIKNTEIVKTTKVAKGAK